MMEQAATSMALREKKLSAHTYPARPITNDACQAIHSQGVACAPMPKPLAENTPGKLNMYGSSRAAVIE